MDKSVFAALITLGLIELANALRKYKGHPAMRFFAPILVAITILFVLSRHPS